MFVRDGVDSMEVSEFNDGAVGNCADCGCGLRGVIDAIC